MRHIGRQLVAMITIAFLTASNVLSQPSQPVPRTIHVRKGTALKFKTLKPLDSTTAKVGDEVPLRLDQALVVDGATLLQRGQLVIGRVTKIRRAGPHSRHGEVKWKLERITFPDSSAAKCKVWFERPGDTKVPDKYYDLYAGDGGFTTGEVVGLSIVTIILSPILLTIMLVEKYRDPKHGEEYSLPADSTVAVAITADHRVRYCACGT